jgi:hypothetical protein
MHFCRKSQKNVIIKSVPGIFRKSGLPCRRPEDLPHVGDSRHRLVRIVEDREIQIVSAGCSGIYIHSYILLLVV